jgi:hypothetical protein
VCSRESSGDAAGQRWGKGRRDSEFTASKGGERGVSRAVALSR